MSELDKVVERLEQAFDGPSADAEYEAVLDLLDEVKQHVLIDRQTLEACIEALDYRAEDLADRADFERRHAAACGEASEEAEFAAAADRAAAVSEQLRFKLRQLPRKEQ